MFDKHEKQTLKQLWDETPQGEAIAAAQYQYFCEFLERKTARTVKEMACVISGLWDMTCEQAVAAVSQWANNQIRFNPNYLAEFKEKRRKAYFA